MENIIQKIKMDYHKFTNIDTPANERKRLHVGNIWLNKAKCKKCGDIIQSNNLHDFKSCKCGAITVDGGSWYCKRTAKNIEDFEELSVGYNDIDQSE